MAAANDSQGLKIAVASFVSLSVILAVTSYFMYSNYSAESAKAAEAASKASESEKKATEATRTLREIRVKLGGGEYAGYETLDTLNNAIKNDTKKWQEKLAANSAELAKAFNNAPAGQAKAAEVQKAVEISEQLIKQVISEPQATFNSWIDRMVDMATAETQLSVALMGDNADLRTSLEGVNQSNDSKVKQAEADAKKARDEQTAEHQTYELERKSFLDKIASFQELTGKQANEVTALKGDIERLNQDHEKKIGQLTAMITDLRGKLQVAIKGDEVLARAQGKVTYVDYTRKEIRTTLSRGQGAKERMRYAVYDAKAGVPSDKPKATIELVSVNDRDSVAKVLSQASTTNSIRDGDQIYSAAFGQKKFALVGRMDINRDGRDDRDVVRRMIEMSGGIVSYDLPPPNQGQEKGQLTATIDWLVTDDSAPIFGGAGSPAEHVRDMTKETSDFLKKRSEVVAEGRRLGLQPLPLVKLATYLGYNPNMNLPGQVEQIDKATSDRLQKPAGNRAPKPEAAAEKPKGEATEDAADPK